MSRRIPIVFLVIAWLLALVSLVLEHHFGRGLFSRSGSLMVLFAMTAEYHLLRMRDDYHGNQLKIYSGGGRVDFKTIHPSKAHQYQETAAHITVVSGTIIWGYGDLLFT